MTGHGPLTRRRFLTGAGALALVAACGSDSDDRTGATTTTSGSGRADADGALALAVFFDPNAVIAAGSEQRMPFGLVRDGHLVTAPSDGPATMEITITDEQGSSQTVRAERHSEELPRPYWRASATFESAGIHTATAVIDGQPTAEAVFNVNDPAEVTALGPGEALPPVDTPTFGDDKGLASICTRTVAGEPDPCPFHDATLADALAGAAPVALLVSTPQFCTTAVCGPVLEFLLDAAERHDGVTFHHAEVFVDGAADLPEPAPVMTELGLSYEPVLYVADASGTIVDRLDFTWDQAELDDTLGLVAS